MRYDDQYSARDYRRECSRDNSWIHRQDAAERDRNAPPVRIDPAERTRLQRRLQRRNAVAEKRAAQGY